ncbi:MAG: ABC transporter ATP-binding protein [Candidatus Methanomethylophilaceae archaeon]|nr:ABC transporter ATP-binding protein [Candidatus Methanomethylophilaceae archaeon]MBQ8644004.1 ABC transporter ATP-binding protein [Candidatus Methanomethylophilaceae archaeon]
MEIELRGVGFGYSSERMVLRDIDLRLQGPGLVCIIGPNGVGKSTLVKCMNGLLKPTEGEVLLNGRNLSEYTPKEVSMTIGYVPASTNDVFSMPVIDAILIGRHNHQRWRTTERDMELVRRAMEVMGITDLAMQGYNELSAGQHQKVTLARGLVQETEIMILDEPTANLDVRHQVYVTQLLRELADRGNKLIIMICHDLNIAARYASEVVVMSPPGVIDRKGPSEEVFTAELVRRIYGIDCEIVEFEGKPNVLLKSDFVDQ